MYLCIIIAEYQHFCKNIMCVKLYSKCRVCPKMWMIKVFFDLNTKIFYFYCQFYLKQEENLDLHTCVYLLCVHMTKNTYMYKIHICKANVHLIWAGVYVHGAVYLHMSKLTFTYMQLCSQKYTRMQIIHICIIYIPCVNQFMWTGLKMHTPFKIG